MAYQKFDVQARSIRTMFSENEFVVPRYQRRFAWDNTEIDALWNDIDAAIQPHDPDYFLGTTVFVKDQQANKISTVIDGQQRLATLTILLCAIRDHLEGIGKYDAAQDLDRLIKQSFLGEESFVLTLANQDAEELRRYVQARLTDSERLQPGTKLATSGPGRPPKAFIRNAYDRLSSKCKEYVNGLPDHQAAEKLVELGRYVSANLVIAAVFVPSDEDAYIIFESVNARGLGLSIADLVKNHIFSLAAQQFSLDRVESHWNDLVDLIEPGTLDRFLRYHWLSRYEGITQRRLFRAIKDHLVGNNAKALDFVQELCDSAFTYSDLVLPTNKEPESTTLRQFVEIRVVQHLPFLMAAKEQLDQKGFNSAVKIAEAVYVRYLLAEGLNPNVLEGNYSLWARDIRGGLSIKEVQAKANTFLQERTRPLNQSLPEIEEVTVPQARYLLRKINEAKYGSRELDWSNVTVEHIIPFKPTKEWEQDTGKSVAELTHWTKRLGNVTLLDEGLNIGASNNKFTNKRQRYAESKFDLTQQLAELEEWGTDQIETREREFAELAVQVWALV